MMVDFTNVLKDALDGGENVLGMGGKDVGPIVEPDNYSVDVEDA